MPTGSPRSGAKECGICALHGNFTATRSGLDCAGGLYLNDATAWIEAKNENMQN